MSCTMTHYSVSSETLTINPSMSSQELLRPSSRIKLTKFVYRPVFEGKQCPNFRTFKIRNTYNIFKSDISRHRSEGKVLIDARSSIILVRRVVPAKSGNSVISLASESSLSKKKTIF